MKRMVLHDPFLRKLAGLILTGVCLVLMGVVIDRYRNWLSESETFQLRGIDVAGNDLIREDALVALCQLETPQSVWTLDLVRLEAEIGKNPFIEEVRVHRYVPDELYLRVEEKRPVALLHFEDDLFCIDEGGMVLPSKPGRLYDLPILTGDFKGGVAVGSRVGGNLIQQGLRFLQDVVADRPQLYGHISEIVLGKPEGLIVYLQERGIPVWIGHDRYAWKIRYLDAIVDELAHTGESKRIDHIDLRFKGQIIVGMRT